MSELKACPFCGKVAVLVDLHQNGAHWIVRCSDHKYCETAQRSWKANKELAISKWNHRPIEDALRARIAEMEELVNGMENSPPPAYCCVFCNGYEECLPDCEMMRVMGMVWIPNDKCTAGGAWWEMDSPQGKEYLAGKAD